MRSDNAAISGSIANRSNFMSDCKQMQVRLKNGKYINLERKKYQANMLQNRFELQYRSKVSWQSLEPRYSSLETRYSILDSFEYRVSSLEDRV